MRRTLGVLVALVGLVGLPALSASADGAPVIAGYGDSIMGGTGLANPGTQNYVTKLGGILGAPTVRIYSNGAAAHCWGRWNTDRVVAASPDVVIFALGTNDLGGSYTGCRPTIAQFQNAVDVILGRLRVALPNARIYVSAILWRAGLERQRPAWNAVLREAAIENGATYADPGLGASSFPDGTHPNKSGHAQLAAFWAGVIG